MPDEIRVEYCTEQNCPMCFPHDHAEALRMDAAFEAGESAQPISSAEWFDTSTLKGE